MTKLSALTPGTRISVYPPGGGVSDCKGQYNVPDDGSNLVIRDLAPGPYEARVLGAPQEFPFEVDGSREVCVLPVLGADPEPKPTSDPPSEKQLEELYEAGVLNRPPVPPADAE